MKEIRNIYGKNIQGKLIKVDESIKKENYFCPICNGKLIARKGEIVIHHWAHQKGCTDVWSHGKMTDWHLWWQLKCKREFVEVVMGPHRADIVGNNKTVIELQHSNINKEDVEDRELFYGENMIWIFDMTERKDQFNIQRYGCFVVFTWKGWWTSLTFAKRPIFLDFGYQNGLIKIQELKKNENVNDYLLPLGWGYFMELNHFCDQYLSEVLEIVPLVRTEEQYKKTCNSLPTCYCGLPIKEYSIQSSTEKEKNPIVCRLYNKYERITQCNIKKTECPQFHNPSDEVIKNASKIWMIYGSLESAYLEKIFEWNVPLRKRKLYNGNDCTSLIMKAFDKEDKDNIKIFNINDFPNKCKLASNIIIKLLFNNNKINEQNNLNVKLLFFKEEMKIFFSFQMENVKIFIDLNENIVYIFDEKLKKLSEWKNSEIPKIYIQPFFDWLKYIVFIKKIKNKI